MNIVKSDWFGCPPKASTVFIFQLFKFSRHLILPMEMCCRLSTHVASGRYCLMNTILVVDDELPFRKAVAATLRREGYEVFEAGDGVEGLALATAQLPSIVLSDVNMNGRNGLELLRELRIRPETSSIPVIMMTGEPQKTSSRFSMEHGADDYLQKPFKMEALLAAVQARLERRTSISRSMAAQQKAERLSAAEKIRLQTSALDAAANGIAITKPNGKILWVNHAFTKLTGYSAEEAVGQNPRVLKSGQHPPEFYTDLWVTINAGNIWHGELVNRRKDGSHYHEEMTITPVSDEHGKIQNFIAIKQDITQRKQAEQSLRESEQQFRAMFELASIGVGQADPHTGQWLRVNQKMCAITGYSADELIKMRVPEITHPEDRQRDWDAFQRVVRGEAPDYRLEKRYVRKDGSLVWVNVNMTIMRDAAGQPIRTMATIEDINERKQAESDLQNQLALQEHVAKISMTVPGVIYTFRLRPDGSNCFPHASPAVEEHLGFPAQELAKDGSAIFANIHPDDLGRVQASISESARTLAIWGDEFRFNHQRRGEIWISGRAVPQRETDGSILWHGFTMEVTERKRAEVALSESEEQYHQLFAVETDAIFMVDRETNQIIQVNPAAETMYGYSHDEFLRLKATDVSAEPEKTSQVIASDQQHIPVRLHRRKNGVVFPVEISTGEFMSRNRWIHVAAMRDITERKRTEVALLESQRFLKSTLDALSSHIAILDEHGTIIEVNAAWNRFAHENGFVGNYGVGDNYLQVCRSAEGCCSEEASPVAIGIRSVMDGTSEQYYLEYPCHSPQEQRWFIVRATRFGGGGPVRVVVAHENITERMESEMQIERLQNEHAVVLNSLGEGVHWVGVDGRIKFENPASAKMLGYEIDELIGKPAHATMHYKRADGTDYPVCDCGIYATLRDGISRRVADEVFWRKDGTSFPVDYICTPAYKKDGSSGGSVVIFTDITERKRTEEKLYLQNSALSATANGIAITDRNGLILWVNPAFTRLTGYDISEAIGKTHALLKSGVHDRSFYKHIWDTITSGKGWHGELVNRRKDGSLYHEETTITPVSDEHGNIQNFIAIKQDVSGRKRNEQLLAHERDLLQALMDNLPDHIYFKDASSRFIRVNRAMARHLGLAQAEDAIGKSDADFFPGGQARQKLMDEQFLLTTGQPILGLVEKSDTANEANWVSSTKVPVYGADGKVTGLVGISRDITAYKEAELERHRMEVQLRQSQKLESVGQLAAGIAHEINTPTQYVGDNTRFVKDSFVAIIKVLHSHEELLTAAKQNAVTPELLARNEEILAASDLEYLCEQIPSALKETLEGIERVSKIVRAMKEFSHPGGKDKTPADLNRAIESTVTVARNEWKYVADLKLELEPDLPPVPCFISGFNQCILNLVVNAAHAIGDVVKKNPGTKGNITICTHRDGDHVEVRVSDTGTGIAEAHRKNIFEPFFTTKDVGKGTGQGLTMIYGCIVNRHGGTVTFETEVSKGTTFIIRLPLKPQTLMAAKSAAQPEAHAA